MQGKKVTINSNDYEVYQIPLSLKCLFGKRKNKYISTELSKRHPCFSDDCSFDSKCSITTKGFQAKVIVVSNYTLKKYEGMTSGIKIYSKEFKNKLLFKNKGIKQKHQLYGVILFFILIISFFTYLMFTKKGNNTNCISTDEINTCIYDKRNNISYPNLTFISKSLFETIAANNGEIKNLSWSLTGFTEKIICNIENIYPENFLNFPGELNFSALSFPEGKPEFSITASSKIDLPDIITEKASLPKENIRTLLKLYNMNLQKENVQPYELFFQGPIWNKKDDIYFFDSLAKICSEHNLLIENFTISKSKKNVWNCQITFSESNFLEIENVISIINRYRECFEKKEENIHQQKNKSNSQKSMQKQKIKHVKQYQNFTTDTNRIGTVTHQDGSVTSFYKTKEGKIEIKKK